MSAFLRGVWMALLPLFALLSLGRAAFIDFENCLDPGILSGSPLQLQFSPLFYDAVFETAFPNRLTVTIYGNVTGQQVVGTYPPPSSPTWQDPTDNFGKIANIGSSGNYSTLFADFAVLTYSAYDAPASRFCAHIVNGSCPVGPRFHADSSNPYDLAAFSVTHNFDSGYRFSTLASTIRVISGDTAAQTLACVSANITPALGSGLTNLITWLPAAILILKGVATLAAAIWSPWGSFDIFRWSSNYGRDPDLLRLVTPGFGDCLQYIQFATLMGSLTLQYPGFFQPAISETAWSLLLFNESWVTHGSGTQSLVDGVYVVNGTYGISAMRQLIGMTDSIDVWACMAIWLAIIALVVIVLCQLGFFARWVHRIATKTSEEDLRQKNLPFTLGNMIRLLFNFFILPIVSLSLFQLVISPRSPSSVVGVAAVLLALIIIAGAWILRVIFTTKPRTQLFDDMPTVLLYGPLYNTYSDKAAPFALVPVLITFMRGVAFGAAQPSGTAQIIILAVCEVILIITLNGFRPFQNQTSMNAYHTFFAAVRLVTVMLCIAFVPALRVSEAKKGWIGYAILLMHGCVLVFGFFLNSAQTLIEVFARSAGLAGHDAQTGEARGSILSWRMLKKRRDRPAAADRASMASNQAILQPQESRDGHSRDMSASSQQLLKQPTPNLSRMSGFENFLSSDADKGLTDAAGSEEQGAIPGKRVSEQYYRPPRRRTATLEELTPGAKSRIVSNGDILYSDSLELATVGALGAVEAGRESPAPAFFRDRADSGAETSRTDYAVREVDQYYRGPPLAEQPTRKLKTGPADPEGPAASAQTWFQRLFMGTKKQKESGKGFEVVRSSRMPLALQPEVAREEVEGEEPSPPQDAEPYQDSPEMMQQEIQASGGAERSVDLLRDEEPKSQGFDFGIDPSNDGENREVRQDSATPRRASAVRGPMHPGVRAEMRSRNAKSVDVGLGYITRPSGDTEASSQYEEELEGDEEDHQNQATYSGAPSLGPIETGGGLDIRLPSRFNSRSSSGKKRRSKRSMEHLPDPARSAQHQPSESFGKFGSAGGGTYPTFIGAPVDEDRPSSFSNTTYHRAGDSITRNSLGANAALNSSSAEFVQGSPPVQTGFNSGRF